MSNIPRKFYDGVATNGGGISKPDIPEEIKKQIEDEAFRYAKSLYTHAKDEDIKESSQLEAYKEGAEFGYNLSQQQITSLQDRIRELEKENERLKGLIDIK